MYRFTYMWVYVWRSEVNLDVIHQVSFALLFEGLLLTWNLSDRLDWLAIEHRDHCSHVPRVEPTNLCHHMAFLCGYLISNSDLHALSWLNYPSLFLPLRFREGGCKQGVILTSCQRLSVAELQQVQSLLLHCRFCALITRKKKIPCDLSDVSRVLGKLSCGAASELRCSSLKYMLFGSNNISLSF